MSEGGKIACGVPLGSILGPLLFNLYLLPLAQIMQNNSIFYNNYADNKQICIALSTDNYCPIDSLNKYIQQNNEWMCHNFLQLNKDKIEIIVFSAKEERFRNAY